MWWHLLREEKPEYPDKNPWSRVENQHKLSPHMTPGPGIEPRPHWWEASALVFPCTTISMEQNPTSTIFFSIVVHQT